MKTSCIQHLLVLPTLLALTLAARAQISLTSGTITENFNGMAAGTSLPANWKVSAAGTVANWTSAGNLTIISQVASSGTPATAGSYNWGTTAGTDRAVGFLTNGGFAAPNTILAHYQNNTGSTITELAVSFQVERYHTNTSPFFLQFFTSGDGTFWTVQTGGSLSAAVYPTGASAYDFTTPRTVYKTVVLSGLNIASGSALYLRWVFGSAGTSGQGLGLDNVVVSVNTTSPAVEATLTDALTTDVNGNSKANEGDKLTYSATLKSSGKDATGVQYTAPLDANTTLSGDVRSTPLAVNDNFSTALNTAAGGNVKSNDFGLPAAAFNVVSFGATETPSATAAGIAGVSDNGGTVQVNADGSFTYTPPTGFVGYDRFAYTLAAGVAPNDVGIVTVAVGAAPSAGAAESFPGVIGNVAVTNALSLTANDGGDGISIAAVNGAAVSSFPFVTTTTHGNLTINANGTFTYNPAPGYTGPDDFSYTIDNGFSSPVIVTVPITVSGMIWFIDNSQAGNGDGRLGSPFNSLENFVSGATKDPGDNIFLYRQSVTNYSGGLALLNNQKLIGQGSSLSLTDITGLSSPSYSPGLPSTGGTNPTIVNTSGNGITLAQNNTIVGLNVGSATGFAIDDNGTVGTLSVNEVTINNPTGGGFRTDNGGTLAVTLGSLSSAGGVNGINLSGTGGSFTVSGQTTISNSSGVGLDVSATASGSAVNLNAITVGGTGSHGIVLTNNTGTFTATGLTTINAPAAGANISLHISGGGGAITFGTIDINGRRDKGIRIAGGSRNITTGPIDIENPNSVVAIGLEVLSPGGGTINFGTTTINNNGASGSAVEIQGSSAAITFASGSAISNSASHEFFVNGGNGNITYNGTLASTTGPLLAVNGRSGGTTSFTGNLSSTGNGGVGIAIANNTGGNINFSGSTKTITSGSATAVNLANNTGATIDFGNGYSLTTTSGTGFNATGGGTIRISGTGNTISSGTGTALNVANTTIGAPAVVGQGGLNFQSISANGAVNGIVLNNTGTNGGLAISGTGTTNTGGIIQNTTGVGISLNNASNVSLNWIQIANTGSHGISGTGMVDGTGGVKPTLEILNSLLNSPGDGDNESAIYFDQLGVNNILGRLRVTNCTIQNFEDVGVHIGNISGALTVDIDDCIFNNNSDTNGEEGIDIDASGTATITVNITDSRFQDLEGGSMNIVSQGSGTIDLTVNNIVDIGTGGPDNFPTPPAMTFSSEGINSNFFADITNNKILDASGDGIFFGHEGEISVRITGNIITGMATGDGIRIDTDASGNQTTKFLIENNSIGTAYMFESINYSGCGDDGIQILERDGTKAMHLTIRNNQIANTASEAIRHFADDDVSGGGPDDVVIITGNTFNNVATNGFDNAIVIISQDPGTTVCTNISANNFIGSGRNISLQQSPSATLQIIQSSVAAVAASNTNATASSIGTITFNGTCTIPVLPSH